MILTLNKIKKGLNRYTETRKIFCIGHNKTGTTSLALLFAKSGYRLAPQRVGEALTPAWYAGDFKSIIEWVKSTNSQFFQDVPFSYPETWKHLTHHFPNALFIHTIRDSDEAWYQSRIRFDKKIIGSDSPGWKDLEEFKTGGLCKGSLARFRREIMGCTDDPYDESTLKSFYNSYNQEIEEYFENSSLNYLKVNLMDSNALHQLNAFVKPIIRFKSLPHKNQSKQ